VADDSEGIAGAAEHVAAMMIGAVGVVFKCEQQPSHANPVVEPPLEQGSGTPQGHAGYPLSVKAESCQQALGC
jgi:hypothetical protein